MPERIASTKTFRSRSRARGVAPLAALALGAALLAPAVAPRAADARTLVADPRATSGQADYYRTLARSLTPGDTLMLPAGTYPDHFDLDGLQGTATNWIVIMGPASGSPATITTNSTCCNTVQLGGNAYLAIKNLTIDSAGLSAIDGLNAKGNPTHDILVENCTFVGQNSDQATLAISTKSPAWRWTIRGNRIMEAGTGIYLGNSDGTQPFIAGVIENNLFQNTIGYNMELKFQLNYDGQGWVSSLPAGPNRTIIRNNVFIKEKDTWAPGQTDGVRPNLLVDPFPDTGTGSSDMYEIYGNFFYKNPNEALFQGTGRMAVHDNVFLASSGGNSAGYFTDHNGPLKLVHLYNNTVFSIAGNGFTFAASPRQEGYVRGNLVVTGGPGLGGSVPATMGNKVGLPGDGNVYFVGASEALGPADLYPAAACTTCRGTAVDLTPFAAQTDYDRDFNGVSKGARDFRGAYAGQGTNPGWHLQMDLKTTAPSGPADTTPPDPPANVQAR